VVIRRSRATEIGPLIAALGSDSSVDREAAVARLRVIGPRAVERLTAFLATNAAPTARAAALEALFDSDDPRTLILGLDNLAHAEADVAVAAVGVLRGWVTREAGTRVLDALTGAALDPARHARVRLAALDALSSLPRDVVQPVLQQASPADGGSEPSDALEAREWLASHEKAPLSELHEFVVRAREQERNFRLKAEATTTKADATGARDWLVARGAAHAVLARRGSTVALYDLREAFDSARAPLPLDFLTAVGAIGDATCLEPMARAWAATPTSERWWRERLADAAADIVHRTRLSGRSAVMKRLRAKFHGFV
jgi:hypothetical protein